MKIIIPALAILCVQYLAAQPKNFIDQPYIEVTAAADSLVTPNQIFIRITLSERDSKDKNSIEELETKMVDLLKTMGIRTETDLTATDILSNYQYYLLRKKDIIKTKQYMLKVMDAYTATKVFIGLEDINISNVVIDRVGHSQLDQIKDLCRIKAIVNAKTKASSLTKTIGQSIGSAIHIADVERPVIVDELNKARAEMLVSGYGIRAQQKYEDLKIDFEKIYVSMAVSAKFALK